MKKEVSFIVVLLGAFFTSFGMSFIWPLTSGYFQKEMKSYGYLYVLR